jgi:hypothetical protein
MKRWWIGAALAAMCVGQSAWGQQPPGDGGQIPEPAPVAPCPPQGPQLFPGPLTGPNAPPGPGDALSLPASLPTAWGKGPMPESGCYFSIGSSGLQFQTPGHSLIALDQGRVVANTHDVDPPTQWGVRATLGYLYDDSAIELTGYYLPPVTTTSGFVDPGLVNVLFINPPSGFLGANGTSLFLGADAVNVSLQTSLGNAELNYRWWSRSTTSLEGIVGFRYVEVQERARVATDASRTVEALTGIFDPTLQATYTSRTNNHLLMGQFGFEGNWPIKSWLSLGLMAKFAFGADDVDQTNRLQRGDGLVVNNFHNNHWTYSGLYEINAYLDLLVLDRLRIRGGWATMWIVHIDEAFTQIDRDLSATAIPHHDAGSIFFNGPMIEVQMLF